MRILGLDLGTKTLGVAISDKSGIMATPLTLIKFKNEDYNEALNELKKIIDEYDINTVVLGLPKNMDGTLGFAAERSIQFKNMLENINIEVILEDERLTSVSAINILKDNGKKNIKSQEKTDIISAELILDSYLKRIK